MDAPHAAARSRTAPKTEQLSQAGPKPEPEPSVASTSRTEREPIRPMLAGPGSEPDPWGPEPDRTTPTRTEREPDTLRTGAPGAGPMIELSFRARAGPEPDVPRPYQCVSVLLGLPSGRRQPARTMDLVLSVPPDGPGLGWILNEPSRGGRVRRPCPCR